MKEFRFNIITISYVIISFVLVFFLVREIVKTNKDIDSYKEEVSVLSKKEFEYKMEYARTASKVDSLKREISVRDSIIDASKRRIVSLSDNVNNIDTVEPTKAYQELQANYPDTSHKEHPFSSKQVQSIHRDLKEFKALKPLYFETKQLANELSDQVDGQDALINIITESLNRQDSLLQEQRAVLRKQDGIIEDQKDKIRLWRIVSGSATGAAILLLLL